MGTWGTGIFDDDCACDIRDEYLELLDRGHDHAAAAVLVLTEIEDDDRAVAVLALAATQLHEGDTSDEVLDEAIALIETGAALEAWRDASREDRDARTEALDSLYRQMTE